MQPLAPTQSRSSSPSLSRFLHLKVGQRTTGERSSHSGWLIARQIKPAIDRSHCGFGGTQATPRQFLQIATGQWGVIDQATHFCIRSAAEYYLIDRRLHRDGSVSILNYETAQLIAPATGSFVFD